jgi:hypothetical protein
MSRYEAAFEVESKNRSQIVQQVLKPVHDTIRDESRTIREETENANELLAAFETLQDAAMEPSPWGLTIVYERYDEDFED